MIYVSCVIMCNKSCVMTYLECPVLGVEGEAELYLAAVVSHDEAVLTILLK